VKRIYISLTSALSDLGAGRVSIDDIDSVVSNTMFDTVDIAIEEYAKPGYRSTRMCEATVEFINQLWPKIIQPRLLWKTRGLYSSHCSGERYVEVPADVNLNSDADRIRFVYQSVLDNGGWVWSNYHANDVDRILRVWSALDNLK